MSNHSSWLDSPTLLATRCVVPSHRIYSCIKLLILLSVGVSLVDLPWRSIDPARSQTGKVTPNSMAERGASDIEVANTSEPCSSIQYHARNPRAGKISRKRSLANYNAENVLYRDATFGLAPRYRLAVHSSTTANIMRKELSPKKCARYPPTVPPISTPGTSMGRLRLSTLPIWL